MRGSAITTLFAYVTVAFTTVGCAAQVGMPDDGSSSNGALTGGKDGTGGPITDGCGLGKCALGEKCGKSDGSVCVCIDDATKDPSGTAPVWACTPPPPPVGPPCPATVPTAGDKCSGDLKCSYDTSSTCTGPGIVAYCKGGTWWLDKTPPPPPPDPTSGCPGTEPAAGSGCKLDPSMTKPVPCVYKRACTDGTAVLDNATCVPSPKVPPGGAEGMWVIDLGICGGPPPVSVCPKDLPASDVKCSEGLSCKWDVGGAVVVGFCKGGLWLFSK
jgi:hypothetical protein